MSAQLWSRLLQAAPDAIVVTTSDGRIVLVNARAERMFGHRAEDLVGQPAETLVPAGLAPAVMAPAVMAPAVMAPAVVAAAVPATAGAALAGAAPAGPEPWDGVELTARRRDGSEFPVELSRSEVSTEHGRYVVVALRDASERRRAPQPAEALLEAVPDPLLGIDDDGLILFLNGHVERAFGYPRQELVGQPVTLLLPDGRLAAPADLGTPGGGSPATARHRDGHTFPVEVAVSTMATEGAAVTCLTVRDLAERLHAQAERAGLRAQAQRQRLAAHLHRTDRLDSLGRLAGRVAHDFNNLLGVIVNYATFVIEEARAAEPDRAAMADDAEQIMRAGERGANLTRQLLSFARREVSSAHLIDLNKQVSDLMDRLRAVTGEHITVQTSLAPDLPAIEADPAQLEQVLLTLAANARDAMPTRGELVIDTSVATVEALYTATRPELPPGRYVRLRVGDCGAGMPPEVLDRAFEPFFTTKATGSATGLGLAMVYGMVAQAGGAVVLESREGFGTTAIVLLPTAGEPAAVAPSAPEPPAAGRDRTVLLVTVDAMLREVVGDILAGAGYRVLGAGSGAEALARAADHRGEIALLVSDVATAGMPGSELAGRLAGQRPGIRVLHLSWHARSMLAACSAVGPDEGLLDHPFTAGELLRAVADRLAGG